MAINNAGVTLDENSLLWRYLGEHGVVPCTSAVAT